MIVLLILIQVLLSIVILLAALLEWQHYNVNSIEKLWGARLWPGNVDASSIMRTMSVTF